MISYRITILLFFLFQSLYLVGQGKVEKDDILLQFLESLYQGTYEIWDTETNLEKETQEYFDNIHLYYLLLHNKEIVFKNITYISVISSNDSKERIETYHAIINQDTIRDIKILEGNKIYLTNFQIYQLFNIDKKVRNKILEAILRRGPELGLEWFGWSLPSNDALVNYLYAEFLYTGYFFHENLPEDFQYDDIFKYASLSLEQGNKDALYTIDDWVESKPTPERIKVFIELFEKEASKNNIDAIYILAEYYLNNYKNGLDVDPQKYLYWFEKCFELSPNNNIIGIICVDRLYFIYAGGKGVERDDEKALEWLNRGIEKGYYRVYLKVGRHYMMEANYPKAREAFEEALKHRVPESYQWLSLMIADGLAGFEKDKEKAERYKKAYELLLDCPDCWEEAEKIANGN